MIRRTFSSEFKLDAIHLVLQQGYSVTQACQALSIGQTALRRWIKHTSLRKWGLHNR